MRLYTLSPGEEIAIGDCAGVELIAIRHGRALVGIRSPHLVVRRAPKTAFEPRSERSMKHHQVKIWPAHLPELEAGRRTAELRVDDRDYQPGDVITFQAYDPVDDEYLDRGVTAEITHAQRLRDLDPRLRDALGLNPSLPGVNNLAILSIRRI